jgi:hypothetical protein
VGQVILVCDPEETRPDAGDLLARSFGEFEPEQFEEQVGQTNILDGSGSPRSNSDKYRINETPPNNIRATRRILEEKKFPSDMRQKLSEIVSIG